MVIFHSYVNVYQRVYSIMDQYCNGHGTELPKKEPTMKWVLSYGSVAASWAIRNPPAMWSI